MKKSILSLFVIFSLFACSNDDDSNGNGNGNGDDIFITFKANGTGYTMEPYTASSGKVDIGGEEGMDDSFRAIRLSLPLDFTTGSHTIEDSFDLEAYTANYTDGNVSIDATSGTITITSINNEYIEGTFSFTGEDQEGTTYEITEGSFKTYSVE